jgi:hypothetical protein
VFIGRQGKEIPDSAALRNEVAQIPIGQEARLAVLRSGRKEEMTAKVGSLDEPVEGIDRLIDLVSAATPGKRASFTALDHRTGNTGNIFVTIP